MRARIVVAVVVVLALGGGYGAGRVALEPTAVPIGSRQLFPIFWHVVVREPGGAKRFLEKHGRLARGAPGVRHGHRWHPTSSSS